MELEHFDFNIYDEYDLAFEVEAESYITAVKQALLLEESYLIELEQTVKAEKKYVAIDEAVQLSKFVTEARQRLNMRAANVMQDFCTDIQKVVRQKLDQDAYFYSKYMRRMLENGKEVLGNQVIVTCRKADAHFFEGEMIEATLEDQQRGIVVKSADAKIQVDLTLYKRVEQVLHYKQPQLAGLLIADYRFIE